MKRLIAAALLALTSSVFAATLNPVQLLNPAGSTSGQAIVSTGASTAPAWGNVTAAALAAQAANTVVANITASSASPTAVPIPTCNTSTSALQYTPVTGWACYANSATTTGTLAQFAATTSAQLAGVLSDETGSGVVVFSASPTFTGTVTTAALTSTGLITPSSTVGIKGTTTNDNAQAGSVGEYPTPANLSAVSLTSGTAANVSSVSLPAGDYDVECTGNFNPAAGTTFGNIQVGVSTTSATQPGLGGYQLIQSSLTTGLRQTIKSGQVRVPLGSTTTVYCVATTVFGTSTMTADGFMRVRRPR